MKQRIHRLLEKIQGIPDVQKILSLIVGFIFMWIYKNQITAAIFSGKGFYGRNLFYQLFFILFVTLLFAGVLFLLINLFQLLPFFGRFLHNSEKKYQELLENLRADRTFRIIFSLGMIAVGVATIYLVNNLLVNIDTENWLYTAHNGLPGISPIGIDFRTGFYRAAQEMFVGKSIQEILTSSINSTTYPPFVTLVGISFLLFNENTAYLIQASLLILANIICLVLSIAIIKEYLITNLNLSKNFTRLILGSIFFAILFLLIFSYPFAFSLERGNYDIFALLFSLLGIWELLRHPEKLWAQVILITIATQLKIYPAILFLILLKQHGKKLILPVLLTNLAFLLLLGPNNALAFFVNLMQNYGVGNKWPAVVNHSSYSFIRMILDNYIPSLKSEFIILWIIFTLIPIAIWGFVAIKYFRNKVTPLRIISLLLVSISVMDMVTTESHDYKLVILFPAALILLALILKGIMVNGNFIDFLQLILLFVILLFISRSYLYFGELNYYYLANKYLWSLALESLAAWNCLRLLKEPAQNNTLTDTNSVKEF